MQKLQKRMFAASLIAEQIQKFLHVAGVMRLLVYFVGHQKSFGCRGLFLVVFLLCVTKKAE